MHNGKKTYHGKRPVFMYVHNHVSHEHESVCLNAQVEFI